MWRRLLHAFDVIIKPYVIVITADFEEEFETDAVNVFIMAGATHEAAEKWINAGIHELKRSR